MRVSVLRLVGCTGAITAYWPHLAASAFAPSAGSQAGSSQAISQDWPNLDTFPVSPHLPPAHVKADLVYLPTSQRDLVKQA